VLTLRNVETYYGPIRAVSGVSLEVREGQIVALLGANGAGKTTVLKTVCGLVEGQPEKGTIEFLGTRLNGLNTEEIARLGVAYVQEGRPIFDELTVDENLMLGGYLRRASPDVAHDRARVLDCFPILGERGHQVAGTLSGGEQRMLAIGAALMARPRLLLLDEPSLGLAPLLVKQIFEIIERINRERTTVLLVEQNATMALRIADYGYLLEAGRIALSDTATALLDNEGVRQAYLGAVADASPSAFRLAKRRRRWR
jgi:branched-chain amino acid transport system ATP-binding protein